MPKRSAKKPPEFKFDYGKNRDPWYGALRDRSSFVITHKRKKVFETYCTSLHNCCSIKMLTSFRSHTEDQDLLNRAFSDPQFEEWVRKIYSAEKQMVVLTIPAHCVENICLIKAFQHIGWTNCGVTKSIHLGGGIDRKDYFVYMFSHEWNEDKPDAL